MKRCLVWQSDSLLCWQGNVFCRRAKGALPLRIPQPDTLAHTGSVHPGPNSFDNACPVRMRNDAGKSHHSARSRTRAQLYRKD